MRNEKGQFIKGQHNFWTREHYLNHKKSFGKFKGNKHWNWNGDRIGYKGLHSWITRNFGRLMLCEKCGIIGLKRYHWANTGIYNRERKNWIRLCPKCHYKLDWGVKGNPHKKHNRDIAF